MVEVKVPRSDEVDMGDDPYSCDLDELWRLTRRQGPPIRSWGTNMPGRREYIKAVRLDVAEHEHVEGEDPSFLVDARAYIENEPKKVMGDFLLKMDKYCGALLNTYVGVRQDLIGGYAVGCDIQARVGAQIAIMLAMLEDVIRYIRNDVGNNDPEVDDIYLRQFYCRLPESKDPLLIPIYPTSLGDLKHHEYLNLHLNSLNAEADKSIEGGAHD